MAGKVKKSLDTKEQSELVRVHVRANEATDALHAQAKDLHKMGKVLEKLAKDSTLWYEGLRGRWGQGLCGRVAFASGGCKPSDERSSWGIRDIN
jgi:hypothetical protein